MKDVTPKESNDNWISVDDRLPEEFYAVLVRCPEFRNTYCASLGEDGIWYYFTQGLSKEVYERVTHWMPLPKPPKSEGKEA